MRIAKSISLSTIKALKPGDEIRDPVLKGFGARRRNNAVSYFVHTQINNRLRWFTIGRHGAPWTPETARARARQILENTRAGEEPREGHKPTGHTFESVFNLFIEGHSGHLKPSTATEYKRVARKSLFPHFGAKDFSQITRAECVALHRRMQDTPSMANHALAITRMVFNWADVENIHCPSRNPCAKIKQYKEQRRARFLTVEDLARLAATIRTALAAGTATPIQVSAILLLLFTGARRNEIFTLKRSYVDKHRMIAHLPDSKTGSKVLHLNPHAMAVLDSIPQVDDNPYYLAGRFPGTCITEIKKPWDKIRKAAGLERFRLHDFRHSYASFAADTGASARAVGALLGHASIETTKLYIHLFNSRAKETAQATADTMHAIISQAPLTASVPQRLSQTSATEATRSDPQGHKTREPFFPPHCG